MCPWPASNRKYVIKVRCGGCFGDSVSTPNDFVLLISTVGIACMYIGSWNIVFLASPYKTNVALVWQHTDLITVCRAAGPSSRIDINSNEIWTHVVSWTPWRCKIDTGVNDNVSRLSTSVLITETYFKTKWKQPQWFSSHAISIKLKQEGWNCSVANDFLCKLVHSWLCVCVTIKACDCQQ